MVQRVPGVLLAVGAVVLTAGCATKGFVREEVRKSETKVEQQVSKVEQQASRVEGELSQSEARGETRVKAVANEVTDVRGLASEAGKQAEQASRRAEEATGKAGQAMTRAEEAAGAAGQAATRAEEASGKATQALTKAGETDDRLTRLWKSREKRNLVETVVITFGFDKWELDDKAQTALLDLAKQIQQNSGLVVDLEGYTDSMGPTPYNLQLSQRRSEAVRRFLVEQGVDLHRIQSIGLGPSRPVADNKTKEGRDQNRRVAVKLFAPGD
jgi:outer membrane protein OmpA-like peptidoglycan-associated protein